MAAANFNNTTHNYNISPNGTPMAVGGQTQTGGPPTTSNGGGENGPNQIEIPFMYFTPRDAIKFKKVKTKANNIGVLLHQ